MSGGYRQIRKLTPNDWLSYLKPDRCRRGCAGVGYYEIQTHNQTLRRRVARRSIRCKVHGEEWARQYGVVVPR